MTNFKFTSTIPARPNNPSNDQPRMLLNNSSTSGIIAVDHIGFNADNGGEHKAIHFNTATSYVPVGFPVLTPQLFTTFTDNPPRLQYYAGADTASKDQYQLTSSSSTGGNSSTFALGGVIIKTGKFTTTNVQTENVNYTTAAGLKPFPSDTLYVHITPTNAIAIDILTNHAFWYLNTYSKNGFTLNYTGTPVTGAATYNFVAIGF